ncbi:hypothetical protein RI129_011751 [Pyrocoelia pectoralis]|uniref:Peptidase A2 domain-containing protein n=1 Tax=Pyrocoelia pectoralis TaxID=417401 RepID=A0AAN7V9E9_9COLE
MKSAKSSSRLFIHDKETGMKFLIDSGADVSVMPPNKYKKKTVHQRTLFAANGTPINTYGEQLLSLDLGLRRTFRWPFIIANVSQPIIGADFLDNFKLLIDLHNKRILDSTTSLCSIASIISLRSDCSVHTIIPNGNKFQEILLEFPQYCYVQLQIMNVTIQQPKHFISFTLKALLLNQKLVDFQ